MRHPFDGIIIPDPSPDRAVSDRRSVLRWMWAAAAFLPAVSWAWIRSAASPPKAGGSDQAVPTDGRRKAEDTVVAGRPPTGPAELIVSLSPNCWRAKPPRDAYLTAAELARKWSAKCAEFGGVTFSPDVTGRSVRVRSERGPIPNAVLAVLMADPQASYLVFTGVPTTLAVGEEGGPPPVTTTRPVSEEGGMTTKALGEEGSRPPHVTTFAVGEEGAVRPPSRTTKALNEEAGFRPPSRTTKALNEEAGFRPPVRPTTLAVGEEGGRQIRVQPRMTPVRPDSRK
jgi:hypothetical protein